MAVRFVSLMCGLATLYSRKIPGTHFILDAELTQLEGLYRLKNPVTSSGIEPITFWLAA
jgi:hypothetical protein